jgi:hypothetical protein
VEASIAAVISARVDHVEQRRAGGEHKADDDEGSGRGHEGGVSVPAGRGGPGVGGADERGAKGDVVEAHSEYPLR